MGPQRGLGYNESGRGKRRKTICQQQRQRLYDVVENTSSNVVNGSVRTSGTTSLFSLPPILVSNSQIFIPLEETTVAEVLPRGARYCSRYHFVGTGVWGITS